LIWEYKAENSFSVTKYSQKMHPGNIHPAVLSSTTWFENVGGPPTTSKKV